MDCSEFVGKVAGVGDAISPGPPPSVGSASSVESYLKHVEEYLRRAQKMTSPESFAPVYIHPEQCSYLVGKLNRAVLSARLFKEFPLGVSFLVPYAHDELRVFQRLLRTAKEVEIFIQDCCKPAWVRVAITMTNMSDYVASLGFELELYAVILSGRNKWLTCTEVHNIKIAEEEVVKEKASLDKDALLKRVKAELGSSHGDEKVLCSYLLEKPNTILEISAGSSLKRISGNIFKSTILKEDEMLGRGASATVYKVRWLGMEVAKKTFYGSALATDFMEEASALSELTVHPDLVTFFHFGENPRSCYTIMELMDCDLQTLLQLQGPRPLSVALHIMHQIARGVAYLHEHGIVHRDLRASNVLVNLHEPAEDSSFFHVKIADFGLSKTKEMCRTFSKVNHGSSRWRAPEIYSDAGLSKFPSKADVYSFAMTCYEIVTGHVPFSTISDRSVYDEVLSGGRPQLPGKCPDSLRHLIEECWASDPFERPSFSEIVQTLEYLKYLELTDWVDTRSNQSGLRPDAAISSLSSRIGADYLLCEQLHPHSDGAAATGLIEGTTPIALPDEISFSLSGSRVGAVSTLRQQLDAGTSVIGPTERTKVSEVAGLSPCNPSAKSSTPKPRQRKLGRGSLATLYKEWKDGRWVAKNVFYDREPNVGTGRWMAPEIIKFRSVGEDRVDMPQDCKHLKYPYKVDVYAFGVIYCENLTGQRPFSKIISPKGVKLKVLDGGRPDLPDHFPKRLKYLIERCWEKEPSKRPTFAHICEQLKQVLDPIDETGKVEEFQILQDSSSFTRKVIETSHTRYTSCTVPCSTKGSVGFITQVRPLIVGVLFGIFITLVGMGLVSYYQSRGDRVYLS